MSIQAGQTLDRDTLNRAFTSKSATGTQIMAGSLRLLGGIQIDGATTLATVTVGSLTTGAINAGANNITTTGTITAGTFSGSGASLTTLNASNLSSGTVADARLTSNISLLNGVQTIAANKTLSAAANLYFAGGTTYKIDTAGSAIFNALETKGIITATGNQMKMISTASRKKYLIESTDAVGIGGDQSYHITYGGTDTYLASTGAIGNKFYANATEQVAQIGFGMGVANANWATRLDSRFYGSVSVSNSLEIEGEIKHSISNEFPDPLMASGSISLWGVTGLSYDIQAPTGTGAFGSLKSSLSGNGGQGYAYDYYFDVNPNEWITFSAYAFATTTATTGQLVINWYDASKVLISNSGPNFTFATSWTRYSITAQAPATARYFKVEVDNDNVTADVYHSAFQVERGRAMTGFKPYSGGATASFFDKGLKIGSNGEIHSGYNNNYIIKDHADGNVTLSAAGGNLHLGWQNTAQIRLGADLYTSNGTTKIIDTAGKLYYQGNDIDGRYVTKGTDSVVTSRIRMEGATAQLFVANQQNIGTNPLIDLAIGDSDTGFDWVSDGKLNFVADNTVVATMGKTLAFDFKVAPTLNGTKIWHEGNDGAGSTLDADTVDTIQASSFFRSDADDTASGWYTFTNSRLTLGPGTATPNASIVTGLDRYLEISSTGTTYPEKVGIVFHHESVATSALVHSNTDVNTSVFNFITDDTSLELQVSGNKVWHAGNDGAGSTLDADTLDTIQASQFMRNDQANTTSGNITFGGTPTITDQARGIIWDASDKEATTDYSDIAWIKHTVNSGGLTGSVLEIKSQNDATDGVNFVVSSTASGVRINGYQIWNSGNDGANSGLDADLLDGLNSDKFMRTDTSTSTSGNIGVGGLPYLSGVTGSYREGGQLNFASRFNGKILNRNPDFIQNNMTGYGIYDNAGSGRLTYGLISDDTIPNSTGKLMRISYNPYSGAAKAPTPGFGGFSIGANRTTGNPTTWGYRAGNRYLFRIVANIPSGKSINFNGNLTGTGGGGKWLTSQSGTGNWQEYLYLFTIGNTGTFQDTGYFNLTGGTPVGAWGSWVALTAYAANANLLPATANGFYYTVTTAGTSSGTQPTWPTTEGATVQDKPSANWAVNAAYAVNAAVNPTTANGFFYQCTVAGTSTGTQPAWPTTAGSTIQDSAGTAAWGASIAYAANALVVPSTSNGFYYKCTTAGTSDITEPTWPTTAGSTVTDGTAVWTAYAIATWTARAIVTWTAHADAAFTWDVAMLQVIGVDEVPDVDRAPTLNVGYKSGVDVGWGEIYSTGKITTDSSLTSSTLSTGTATFTSGYGSGIATVYGVGDSYGGGTMLWVKNDSAATSNNYVRLTADTNGTASHFLDIMYAGSNAVTLNNTAGGVINLNGGAVTTGSNLTVGGGTLTINKSSNISTIAFPAGSGGNDAGYIKHIETTVNAGYMQFSASDDSNDTDYFSFGSTPSSTYTEGAKITTAGNATFKGLTVNGAVTITGNISSGGGINLYASNGTNMYGVNFTSGANTSRIETAAGTDIIMRADEFRLGSKASGWDYNAWAGFKYNHATTTMVIGGPTAFTNNSSTARITMAIAGTDAVTIDGKTTINPVNAADIAGVTMANAHLLLGTTTNGIGIDADEITSSGSPLKLITIGANNITLKPNNINVLDVSTTGVSITGTASVSNTLTVTNSTISGKAKIGASSSYNTYAYFGHKDFDTATGYALVQDSSGLTILNSESGKDLIISIGNSNKITILGSNGNVGIGTASPSYKLHVASDILADGWLRTTGAVGWYSNTYGGGWYMTDSTWIKSYGSKAVYVNALTRSDSLQVGTGTTYTAANDFQVLPSGTLNFRNTIWSDGNHTAIRKTSSAHSLDVYTNTPWEGVNLQTSDDTNTVGYTFQNSGGAYVWNMARVNSSTASYPDLVFYGGNNSSLSGLSEILKIYHTKGIKVQGNSIIAGVSTLNHDPAITLALGDSDTGFNWTADGSFDIKANNVAVATITNANLNMNNHSVSGVTTLTGQYGRIANSRSDEWLGINDDASHASGVFFGSSITRTDGQLQVGNNGSEFKASSSGVDIKQKFSMQYNSTEDSLDFVYIG